MPKYLIERDIPGAGNLTRDELREISQLSCSVFVQTGLRNSVDRKFRNPRQNLLHLPGPQRCLDQRARSSRWIPRESNLRRGQNH